MKQNTFRTLRLIVLLLPVAAIALVLIRLDWVAQTPRKPAWLPDSAVWVSAPHTPLEFQKYGEWVGCELGRQVPMRCWFTDYRGSLYFQGLFVPLHGETISELRIAPGELPEFKLYLQSLDETINIIPLQNRTILVPVDKVKAVKSLKQAP
jgi:hypothetical protein